jgi:type II secretory pathway component HofQ
MDKPAVSAVAIATAKNEKLVSLVVDDVPVAQVLQTLAEMQQKIWSWRLTSAVRCRFI